jgi:hypothetical protein
LTALGGKVGSAGAGVEAEEGEGVEVGGDGAKLLTFGVGEVDKDAVLQAGKAQVDRLKAASQQVVLEALDIVGGLSGRGIEASGLGLVKEVIDEVNELAAGFSDFGDHGVGEWDEGVCRTAAREALGDGSVERVVLEIPVARVPTRRPQVSSIVGLGLETGWGIGRVMIRARRKASDRWARVGSRVYERQSDLPLSRKSPMRSTVSLRSEATKKMMTPVEGESPGIALSVATKPAAFAK